MISPPGALQWLGLPNETPVYDTDGNLRFDGRWTMTWDGENRLVKLERPAWTQPTSTTEGYSFTAPANPQGIPPNALPAATIEFKYDGLSRLVERKVTRGVDPPEVEGYLWDGWKLIMIAKLNTNGTFHSRKWSCVWRPDIGSSLYARSDWMRAGGVGGVAWLQTGAVQSYSYGTGGAEVHVPLADHMGNVRHYYQFKSTKGNVTGQLVASYEYDAFGREVRAWGLNTPTENQPPGLPASRPWADLLPFHYSSKLRDVDSGFNYYGYRFYDPGAGRWLNRDPIEERGGVNLYGMVTNDPTNLIDIDGRTGWGPNPNIDPNNMDPITGQLRNNGPAFRPHDPGPMPKWFECIISCGGDVLGIETSVAGTVAAAGSIPLDYPRGGLGGGASSGHSSVAGRVADKIFGDKKVPKCCGTLWAPTLKNLASKSAKWARVAGRGVPIVGWVFLGYDGFQFGCCYYKCMKH